MESGKLVRGAEEARVYKPPSGREVDFAKQKTEGASDMHCLTNKYKKAPRALLQSPAAPAPSRREPMLRQVICAAAR